MVIVAILSVFLIFTSTTYSVGAISGNPNQPTYSYHGNSVTFSGNNALIGIGSESFAQSWAVMSINGSIPIALVPSLKRTYTEQIGEANLVIREYVNSMVKVSEIYSFANDSVEQSIVVQNLLHSNQSMAVFYNLNQRDAASTSELEISNNTTLQNTSSNGVYTLGNLIWGVSIGNSTVSWRNSMSAMGGGILARGGFGESLTLAYSIPQLVYNETYSIDPSISQFPVTNNVNASGAQIWSYDALGNLHLAGIISISAYSDSVPVGGSTNFGTLFGANFEPNNGSAAGDDFDVNYISQSLEMTGNSGGIADSISYYVEDYYYQNYQSTSPSNMNSVLNILYDVAELIASYYGIPLVNPFDFIQHSSIDTYFTNSMTVTYNAGSSYNIRTGYTTYYGLGTNYGFLDLSFKPSYLFGADTTDQFTSPANGYTYSNPLYVYFEYSVTLKVSNGYPNNIASGSQSTDFTLGQYGS